MTFDPPAVNEANLRHPVDFHARATGWMPATDPLELELILGGGSSANERRFPMRLEGDAYHVKAEPTATPPTPSFIQIEALFDDGTIAGRVEDRTVAIAGARLVGLGTLRRLRPAARTVALLGNGETLAGGSVSGLGEATVTVGGQPLTVDLGRARMIAVKPPVEFPAILCTVVARRAAREVGLDAPIYREDRVAPCLEAVRDGRSIRLARSDTPVTYVRFVSGTPERFDGERFLDKPSESQYRDRPVAFGEGDVNVRRIGVESVARIDMVACVGQRVQRTNRARGVTVTRPARQARPVAVRTRSPPRPGPRRGRLPRRPGAGRGRRLGPISDPAALLIVWMAALGVLVVSTSMRPFISLSCSREHDRLKGGASVLCLVPSAAMR